MPLVNNDIVHTQVKYYLVRVVCIALCMLQLNVAASKTFQISGVKDEVLANIQSRLTELYASESMVQDSTEALRIQIEKAMQPYGYFAPRIRILARSKDSLRAHINPGPRIRITTLSVRLTGEGSTNPNILKVLHNLPIKQGQPFSNEQYDETKDALISAAEHEGYLRASFSTAEILIDKKKYTTRINLVLNTGTQYFFGQVRFDPTYISPRLLQRYIPFKPGQRYSTDQILAFESNLSASGYFKSVVVKPHIDGIRAVPIDVHLERASRINYTLGVGFGTDTGPRGRAALHIVPVNRAGHKFNAIAQGSMKQNALLAQYLIPGKNPVTDNYALTASLSNLDYTSGYGNAFSVSLAHQHINNHHQRILSLNGLSERFNYTGQPNNTISLFFPKAALTWKKTTDPLFTPTGYNVTVNGLAASKVLLSEINLAQATLDAKAAITVDAIRTRFFFHTMQGVTGIKSIYDLPLSLAMLLGGAENMQGYSFNAIGPGRLMTYGGLEIQKETYDKWYLVGFVDAGDVYKPRPSQFKYDAGVGLMWVSPVGPIKIGVAQPITNRFKRIHGQNPRLVINMGPDL